MRALFLAVLLMASPVSWALDAEEREAARLVQDYFRQMFEVHDIDAAAKLLSDDFVSHHHPLETKDQMLSRFRRQQGHRAPDPAAPRLQPAKVVVQGDHVFMLLAPPPAPDGARHLFFELYRVHNGRIAEHWDARTEAASVKR